MRFHDDLDEFYFESLDACYSSLGRDDPKDQATQGWPTLGFPGAMAAGPGCQYKSERRRKLCQPAPSGTTQISLPVPNVE